MPKIIATPSSSKKDTSMQRDLFGFFETQGKRPAQQDALTRVMLSEQNLTPEGTSTLLLPYEIGYRLWTTYRLLDNPQLKAGSTASTTVYDGRGNLITATLADTVVFAAVYNDAGTLIGVTRLNSIVHTPCDEKEKNRILNCGGKLTKATDSSVVRVDGKLAVSRSIGDHHDQLKEHGICSEASIDIISLEQIADKLKIERASIAKIQIIVTCDGFTEGAGKK